MSKENPANSMVEQVSFLEELYVARCKDTLEQPSKEEFLRFSSRLKSRSSGPVCSLRNQHLGVSAANTLSKFLRNRSDLVKLDLYCNLIRDQGLQVVSHLLHQNSSIKIFNIGCNDLTDKASQYIAEILSFGHLYSLQLGVVEKALHPNKLTAATMDTIANSIIKSNTLLSLGLNGSTLSKKPAPNSPSADEAISKIFSKNTSLKMLRISNCELNAQMMLNIIDRGLCFNSTLERLDISNNNLPTSVGIRLAEYLLEPTKAFVNNTTSDNAIDPNETQDLENDVVLTNNSPHLFYIDASRNMFGPQVATAFSNSIASYSYLGYLDLSFNDLGDEGAIALSKELSRSQTLVELHLSSNKITPIGGKALAAALKTNQVLTTLNVSKNKLGDETAFALADALSINKAISSLFISSAMLSNEGGIRLARASCDCPTLVTLNMSDNFFTEDTGSSMEKLFKENNTILQIDVSGTQINHFSFRALNDICARNAAALKQRDQKPLRNQLVKSQYSVIELQRKEEILKKLVAQKEELQSQIDALNEQISNRKSDQEINASLLTKQIQEKEAQMKIEEANFEENMKKLDESMKEFEAKKAEVSKTLEDQLKSTAETRAKIEEKKAIFQKMTEEFEAARSSKQAEIDRLNNAADELLKLAQDPDALAQLEELPEFLKIEDDEKEKTSPSPPPEEEKAPSKRSARKSSRKKSARTSEKSEKGKPAPKGKGKGKKEKEEKSEKEEPLGETPQ